MLEIQAYIKGFLILLALIAAIGQQNVFIIRNSLLHNQVRAIVITSIIMDIAMLAAAIFFGNKLLLTHPALANYLALGGGIFVLWCSFNSFRAAFSGSSMDLSDPQNRKPEPMKKMILIAIGYAVLNPYGLLDVFVIFGSISATQPQEYILPFFLGSATGSMVWFSSLAAFAKFLSRYFTNPKTWLVLDIIIGLFMLVIGVSLLKHAYDNYFYTFF